MSVIHGIGNLPVSEALRELGFEDPKKIQHERKMEDRISLQEVFMRMAEELANRSTCRRLSVGTVLTSLDMTRVLAVGYNGNAKGLANDCDSDEPGNCGCIHSEANALIKADTKDGFIAFVTHQPCKMCAKMLVNAGAKKVYFRNPYRKIDGLKILQKAGIEVFGMGEVPSPSSMPA